MAIVKWSALGTRSSNFASTVFNSLANGSESATVTYDNSTNRDLSCLITLKLGSITPSTGGSVTLRITLSDGTDVSDPGVNGELYLIALKSGTNAKTNITPLRIYGCSLRIALINNAGVALAASGNEIYVTPFNEDIV